MASVLNSASPLDEETNKVLTLHKLAVVTMKGPDEDRV